MQSLTLSELDRIGQLELVAVYYIGMRVITNESRKNHSPQVFITISYFVLVLNNLTQKFQVLQGKDEVNVLRLFCFVLVVLFAHGKGNSRKRSIGKWKKFEGVGQVGE